MSLLSETLDRGGAGGLNFNLGGGGGGFLEDLLNPGADEERQGDKLSEEAADYYRRLADLSEEQWNVYKEQFLPIVGDMRERAELTPEKYREAADIAAATTAQQFDRAKDIAFRNATRMGVNPNSGRFAGMNRGLQLARGAAGAGAQNQARRQVQQRSDQINMGLLGAGSDISGQAMQGAQGAAQGYGDLASQQYGREQGAKDRTTDIIDTFWPFAQGGEVDTERMNQQSNQGTVEVPADARNPASAGGEVDGPGTGTSDSIDARLSDGEFIMDAVTTKYWGVKKLRDMQQKAHEAQTERKPPQPVAVGGKGSPMGLPPDTAPTARQPSGQTKPGFFVGGPVGMAAMLYAAGKESSGDKEGARSAYEEFVERNRRDRPDGGGMDYFASGGEVKPGYAGGDETGPYNVKTQTDVQTWFENMPSLDELAAGAREFADATGQRMENVADMIGRGWQAVKDYMGRGIRDKVGSSHYGSDSPFGFAQGGEVKPGYAWGDVVGSVVGGGGGSDQRFIGMPQGIFGGGGGNGGVPGQLGGPEDGLRVPPSEWSDRPGTTKYPSSTTGESPTGQAKQQFQQIDPGTGAGRYDFSPDMTVQDRIGAIFGEGNVGPILNSILRARAPGGGGGGAGMAGTIPSRSGASPGRMAMGLPSQFSPGGFYSPSTRGF